MWMMNRWGVPHNSNGTPSAATHHRTSHRNSLVLISFLSGAGSGMLSATITHPFDLIKTRRQIGFYQFHQQAAMNQTTSSPHSFSYRHVSASPSSSSLLSTPSLATESRAFHPSATWSLLRTIIAEEGYRGLLTGLSARITRIAPASAIMISSYEISKVRSRQDENNFQPLRTLIFAQKYKASASNIVLFIFI